MERGRKEMERGARRWRRGEGIEGRWGEGERKWSGKRRKGVLETNYQYWLTFDVHMRLYCNVNVTVCDSMQLVTYSTAWTETTITFCRGKCVNRSGCTLKMKGLKAVWSFVDRELDSRHGMFLKHIQGIILYI
mgnify:CR=1 FL=1